MKSSKAIAITFWGAMCAFVLGYFLLTFKDSISLVLCEIFPNNGHTNRAILLFILVMVIRHQWRVAFYDSSQFTAIDRMFERYVMALLFLTAVIAGILMLLFTYGLRTGAAAMSLYAFFFLIVGILCAIGQTGAEAEKKRKAVVSIFIDLCNLLVWFAVLLLGPLEGRQHLFFIVVAFAVIFEFITVFREGAVERFRDAYSAVFR